MTTETYFLCRRITKEPEHDGATGYEIYEPIRDVTEAVEARRKIPNMEAYSCNHDVMLVDLDNDETDLCFATAEEYEGAEFIAAAANALDVQEGE